MIREEDAALAQQLHKRYALAQIDQQASFYVTFQELQRVEISIRAKEYEHWRDDDSPKGETVPGVRHR